MVAPKPLSMQPVTTAPSQQQEFVVVDTDALQQLMSANANQDLEIAIPPADCFSEELRIQILNNQTFKQCVLKVYSARNFELSSMKLPDQQTVQLVHSNRSFYCVYTSKQQLMIFNARTTQMIKAGLHLPNVCMMASSAGTMRLVTLATKGLIQVFKIKAVASLDSCQLDWQVGVSELVKGQYAQEAAAATADR